MKKIKKLRNILVVATYMFMGLSLYTIALTAKWYSMKSGYYSAYEDHVDIPISLIPHPKDGINYYWRDRYVVRAYQGSWPHIIKLVKVKKDRIWIRWDKDQ